MKTQLDFGSPEATMQNILKDLGDLITELFIEGNKYVEMEVDLETQTGNTEIQIRNNAGKVNEGFIKASVAADSNLALMKKKAGKQKNKVDCLKKDVESEHDTRKLFSAWMESQRVAGLPV
jgi:hypothetical protein